MQTDSGLVIAGIDGGAMLGFLAAVGLQLVLTERASDPGKAPRLSWRELDAWRPVLHGPVTLDDVVPVVESDARDWADAPILKFCYAKVEKTGVKRFAGLRAPLAVLRQWLLDRRQEKDELSLAYAAALMCETTSEAIEKPATPKQFQELAIGFAQGAPLDHATLRTFFDFTARNTQFLDQLARIRSHLEAGIIRSALDRGQPDPTAARSMDWDPSADTPGAIYTGYVRGLLPVHEWLAFRALACFPITGFGAQIRTTACTGRRLDGTVTWPLWEGPAGPDAVRSIVGYPGLDRMRADERRALGIAEVLCAKLTKKADGRSGMFSPSEPV
jgi:hypothetical protein